MARVSRFKVGSLERMALHDPVEATIFQYEVDGKKLLQINTYGRETRDMPGKVSQSLQFDEDGARELYTIFKDHFGFK